MVAALGNHDQVPGSGNGLFTDPPNCLFLHQATFMTQFFKSEAGARDGEYDFFPMPDLDPTTPAR